MRKLTSTMTTKGQITIPKTIRDVLQLSEGVDVEFDISEQGSVTMKRKEVEGQEDIPYNIIDFAIQQNECIMVMGRTGSGKAEVVGTILEHARMKVVGVCEPYPLYEKRIREKDGLPIELELESPVPKMDALMVEVSWIPQTASLIRKFYRTIPIILACQFEPEHESYWSEQLGHCPSLIVNVENEAIQDIQRIQSDGSFFKKSLLFSRS